MIMLYDEPTTGLDPVTSEEISLLINDVQKNIKLPLSLSPMISNVPEQRLTGLSCYVTGKYMKRVA
jgi:phospholipid/cholesterol/gamma-HCH transport system ATP-binding protein